MGAFLALLRKEIRQLFQTPIPYLVLSVFWIATGYFFSFNVFLVRAAHMVTTFHNMTLLLLLLIPLLTMRSFAEERKSGTLELLMTLPLGEGSIVAAKFGSLWLLFVCMVAGTGCAVVPLWLFADPDVGPIIGGYLGILLLGTAYIGVGILTSVFSENQISAAVASWALLLALWFIDYASGLPGLGDWAGALRHLSLSLHARDLIRGVLSISTVVFFISLTALCLVWATRSLRSSRG